MRNVTVIAVVVSLIGLGSVLAPRMNADIWNQLTKVTFSQPVEIPGQVLPPGTYTFKLMDSQTNRNIVLIYNADNMKHIATILAIPDERLKPTGKTVVTFEERAAGSPQAIKAWFYPGDTYGQEFVYPKVRAAQLAKVAKEPVPSMPQNLEANTKMPVKSVKEQPALALKNAVVKAQQPTGEEVDTIDIFPVPVLLAQNNPPAQSSSPAAATTAPKKLPTTASSLPFVALLGFMLTGAGFGVRLAARRLG